MSLEILGIFVLWAFLFGYVIIASIDFGSGFFNAYSVLTNRSDILSKIIKRYLSPVWEVTNVFLVFFFVGMVGFFPQTAFYYGTALLVPVSISLILLSIRGAYYAFESYGMAGHKGYATAYGVAGLLIPASFSVVFVIATGGFVELVNGQPILDYRALFSSPLTWSIVALSIIAVLYISSVFLTWYSRAAGDERASRLMRKYALIWATPLAIAATVIIVQFKGPQSITLRTNGRSLVDVCHFSYIIHNYQLAYLEKKPIWYSGYFIVRPIRICLFRLRFFSLSVFAVPVFNNLR